MKEVSLSLPQVRPPSRCAGGRFPGELDARATSDRNLIIAPLLIIMILKKYSSALLLRPSSSASRLLYSTMLKPRSPGEYSGNWTPTSKDFFDPPTLSDDQINQAIKSINESVIDMTPSQTLKELDKYIISQKEAKRKICLAIRNKYRQRKLKGEITEFIRPSNILLYGQSGSGKTEIFRQFARIYSAPFIKVEATRYTEVGYHGDDVENIINDLFKKTKMQIGDSIKKQLKSSHVLLSVIEGFIMRLLLGPEFHLHPEYDEKSEEYREGLLDDLIIYSLNRTKGAYAVEKQSKVRAIKTKLLEFYTNRVLANIDIDDFVKKEIETKGIVFIDELDKLAKDPESSQKTKASDQGVQYDLLPLLDGTDVQIKNTEIIINTKNILFVGAGAFSKTKITDLAVELQGRLPVSVKMDKLSQEDFERILRQTKYSLIEQFQKMMETDQVELFFTEEAVTEIARLAVELNNIEENTGARRLRTVIEAVLDEIMFEGPDYPKSSMFVIKSGDVKKNAECLFKQQDYKKYLV